jgi:RNA polymerase sigma factor (sigma-70 family)
MSLQPEAGSRADGDPETDEDVASVLRSHEGALRSYLARRLRNRQDVEDYVQDVYVRVLSSRETKKVESWRGFLLRIASNLLIDRKRRDDVRRRDDHMPIEVEDQFVDEQGHSPERTLLAREELAVLSKTLDTLDHRTRTVFLAVRLEGLSHRDAGARVGVDAKTAARMVERAVSLAARRLLQMHEGGAS